MRVLNARDARPPARALRVRPEVSRESGPGLYVAELIAESVLQARVKFSVLH